jgi:WD40 repeat protein
MQMGVDRPTMLDAILCKRLAWDWSRDNKRLLFNVGDNTVHSADLLSGRDQLLLAKSDLALYQAKFSPDDQAVAVVGCRADSPSQFSCRIYVVPVKNGAAVPVKQWMALDHPTQWDDKPGWSPRGNLLYFVSDRDGQLCLWAQRVDAMTKHFIGTPFPVYHFHSARLALANLGISLTEFGVAKDKIMIGLQQVTGNIWRLSRK